MLFSSESTIACSVMAMWRCFPGSGGRSRPAGAPNGVGRGCTSPLRPMVADAESPKRSDGSEGLRHLALAPVEEQMVLSAILRGSARLRPTKEKGLGSGGSEALTFLGGEKSETTCRGWSEPWLVSALLDLGPWEIGAGVGTMALEGAEGG